MTALLASGKAANKDVNHDRNSPAQVATTSTGYDMKKLIGCS